MNPLHFAAMPRRTFTAAALCVSCLASSTTVWAQDAKWPDRPVKVVVAFTAGGTTDIIARSVSIKLGEKLGQTFVIDNKPGAGGNIGTESVVRAAPDGHTFIINSVGPIAVNPWLYKSLPYDPLKELVPVVQIADVPNMLVVHPSVPANTFEEFVALLKSNPGKLNYGSTGVGTSSHLSSHMLAQRVGSQAVHVPYRGANALNDLLAGRLQFMFATIPSAIQHVKAGKLRALAVSSAKPSRSLPGVPTVQEKGYPGFEAGSWFGFFAPKGTPANVVAALNKAVNEVLPGLETQMINEGADPVGGTPELFSRFIQQESVKWKAIVEASGATAE
ncbi:tripartite tricarboxylate transporter substrate binding protein [Hydrogenophaga sp.]|uniref:Bug family tripartite tricarboxylate transporter substrate binding protein n=1 Tax=Hydrogenophaga sp. TaxID=1904254 RepID=UPI002731AA35|nr:tripartite tricarboxylate transporter substrate binding protein [Hydrogenophaga sp.]MDP2018799.1 tripartite tricarboxylate transporter substrate binding protein [Hydrogenophaga sp.]MDP3165028.1 tripartite tricarboxylate transporter substrate binding protein [Hydrogenophaga sp.]MDP3811623.1 tripartite tricarboxylate transporter substrate binding protein [Hydrogenophaga sp.]